MELQLIPAPALFGPQGFGLAGIIRTNCDVFVTAEQEQGLKSLVSHGDAEIERPGCNAWGIGRFEALLFQASKRPILQAPQL